MSDLPVSTYVERLQIRVFNPGTPSEHSGLIPGEPDVALLSRQLSSSRDQLDRLQGLAPPDEIVALQGSYPDLEGRASELAKARILQWEGAKWAELEAWRAAVDGAERRLRQALEILDADQTGWTIRERRFRMRDFTYGERLDAEDRFTKLNPVTGQQELPTNQIPRRNLVLLGCSLLSELDGAGGETPVKDPGALGTKIAQVLIDRMWLRADLNYELGEYFRGGG